ncbi:MAG TPA: hypothetical protein VH540_15495 [Ktedonobacterales bacterium]|jgi:hypothetical protein
MKAPGHYSRGEHLEQQQATLDPATHSETIVSNCQGAAHHFVCAGMQWAGINHEQAGHVHSKHPSMLKQAAAPGIVQQAWNDLERLRTRAFYGSGTDSAGAADARLYLATIKGWAQSLHP